MIGRCLVWCLIGVTVLAMPPVRRQVVQPSWLRHPDQLPHGQAAKVHITQQNLKEAAAIRSSIQQAVRRGSYVVATNPEQYQQALIELGYNPASYVVHRQQQQQQQHPWPVLLPTLPPMPRMMMRMTNASWLQPRFLFS